MKPMSISDDVLNALVPRALLKARWQTVNEIVQRLHVTRPLDRERVATILRSLVATGNVQVRFRNRIGKGRGCGPAEYTKG